MRGEKPPMPIQFPSRQFSYRKMNKISESLPLPTNLNLWQSQCFTIVSEGNTSSNYRIERPTHDPAVSFVRIVGIKQYRTSNPITPCPLRVLWILLAFFSIVIYFGFLSAGKDRHPFRPCVDNSPTEKVRLGHSPVDRMTGMVWMCGSQRSGFDFVYSRLSMV